MYVMGTYTYNIYVKSIIIILSTKLKHEVVLY